MEIWEPKPPGTLWATPGLLRDPFTFNFNSLHLLDIVLRVVSQYMESNTMKLTFYYLIYKELRVLECYRPYRKPFLFVAFS
jgi:hypothetical protein